MKNRKTDDLKSRNPRKKYKARSTQTKTKHESLDSNSFNTTDLQESQPKINNKLSFLLAQIIIILFTTTVFFPALKNEFTNWDDKSYVYESPILELNSENINAIFFHEEHRFHMGNYHPLAMLSLSIDNEIGKATWVKEIGKKLRNEPIESEYRDIEPVIFHFTNIFLHLLNTIIVFWFVYILFQQINTNRSFLIAFISSILFGIATMHVESVAWVSERKDVLHTFFFLLSLIFYLKYLANSLNINQLITSKKSSIIFFSASIICFFLAVISKAQAVSLFGTIIIIDILLKRKFDTKSIFDKIPFLIIGVVFGIIAIIAQHYGEAIHRIDEFPVYYRLFFASFGFLEYLLKLTIPHQFAAIYPYPVVNEELALHFYIYALVFIVLVIAGIYLYKRNKPALFGLVFFAINIFLQLQLLPVGSAIMADRYSYIPSIGYFIFIAVGFSWLWEKSLKLRPIYISIGIIYCLYVGYETIQQNKVWENSLTLWENTTKISPKAQVAWNNFGSARNAIADEAKDENLKRKYKQLAIEAFNKAIEVNPLYVHALYNRGTSKKDIDLYNEAIADFNEALRIDPSFGAAYHNRGISKEKIEDMKGAVANYTGAIADYTNGIEFSASKANIYSSRGVAYGKSGMLDKAIEDFNKSIELSPNNPEAFSNRGLANDHAENFEEAMADYTKAIELRPEFSTAYSNRGILKRKLGDIEGAISDYTAAIAIEPTFPEAYYNRGAVYITDLKDTEKACADFKSADKYGKVAAAREIQIICGETIE